MNNIVLNDPFLDQALVTQVPTPESRLLATLELPLAGRSFSTDSRGAALELPLAGRSFSIDSLFILQRCQASPCLYPHTSRFSLRRSWHRQLSLQHHQSQDPKRVRLNTRWRFATLSPNTSWPPQQCKTIEGLCLAEICIDIACCGRSFLCVQYV
jgi:hypothetical protein